MMFSSLISFNPQTLNILLPQLQSTSWHIRILIILVCIITNNFAIVYCNAEINLELEHTTHDFSLCGGVTSKRHRTDHECMQSQSSVVDFGEWLVNLRVECECGGTRMSVSVIIFDGVQGIAISCIKRCSPPSESPFCKGCHSCSRSAAHKSAAGMNELRWPARQLPSADTEQGHGIATDSYTDMWKLIPPLFPTRNNARVNIQGFSLQWYFISYLSNNQQLVWYTRAQRKPWLPAKKVKKKPKITRRKSNRHK